MRAFDVIVVGGGPAGAVSALECSRLGLNVLLIEQKKRDSHKPCGGILTPICDDIIFETLKMHIPRSVMCSPETLGLFYVPPSGRRNGGLVRNYRLLNVNRDLFDQWLREFVEKSGVQVWYEREFLGLRQSQLIHVSVKKDKGIADVTAKYLIGADGVHSKVRKRLYKTNARTLNVLQEQWEAEGDFDNNFYAFFRGEISPTYAYVIPKNDTHVLGIGATEKHFHQIPKCFHRFRNWLAEDFAFKPLSLEKREAWAIPYGFVLKGKGKVILVGDAAGFCNALSGEGVRLAMESGLAAACAVEEALHNDRSLVTTYKKSTGWITSFVKQVHKFVAGLKDEDRERFVRSELARSLT